MIPENVMFIMNTIQSHGFEAYIVGGAVRDYHLNRPINDWDITTNALPDVIESMFDQTIAVGKSFGTIIVVMDSKHYEVTTYRTETSYTDGRRPDSVSYSMSLLDDLSRRDFTMNAMVMDSSGQISDYYDGLKDLSRKTLETVGNPKKRFTEDYLRVYRYVRFSCQLEFNSNEKIDSVIKKIPVNTAISFERIQVEFNKILLSKKPSVGINHLKELNLLEYILPGIKETYNFDQHSQYHHLDVYNHLISALDFSSPNIVNRLAALLHDIGKPETFEMIEGQGHFYKHHRTSSTRAEYILKRLKYPKHIIESVCTLIHQHMRLLDLSNDKSTKKFMNKVGYKLLDGYLDLRQADIKSSKTNDDLSTIKDMKETFERIINEKHPMTVNDLDISGFDLIELGYEGRKIGDIKLKLLEHVLEFPKDNVRKILIELISKI